MTISVVIPAYNEEKYLPRTLESLNRLNRKPDEILVIDGQSTDRTVEVAQKYGAKTKVVAHRGIGFARQCGIEASSCDVVAFTDADTIVPADWLNKIEETLNKTGVSGVFGSYRVPDGWIFYRLVINWFFPVIIPFLYFFGIPFAPGQNTSFWKEKALKVGGIPKDFRIAEDIELARRLQTVGKVVYRGDLVVISSGRRGNEGMQLIIRATKAFIIYFIFRKADKVGFPDMR